MCTCRACVLPPLGLREYPIVTCEHLNFYKERLTLSVTEGSMLYVPTKYRACRGPVAYTAYKVYLSVTQNAMKAPVPRCGWSRRWAKRSIPGRSPILQNGEEEGDRLHTQSSTLCFSHSDIRSSNCAMAAALLALIGSVV